MQAEYEEVRQRCARVLDTENYQQDLSSQIEEIDQKLRDEDIIKRKRLYLQKMFSEIDLTQADATGVAWHQAKIDHLLSTIGETSS